MAAKIIYIIALVADCILVPLFLKYSWPQKCKKSLAYKTAASITFIIAGICCASIAGKLTGYGKFVIVGLVFGMIGDVLLHIPTDKQVVFGGGLFAFLIGHIFYIIAYQKALNHFKPGVSVFGFGSVVAIAIIVISCFIYAVMTDMKFGIAAVPVLLYAITISIMVVSAFLLGGTVFLEGFEQDVAVLSTVTLGSLLFLFSDATLAILLFGGQEKNRPLKIFNILTYYIGQILIGSSIMFILAK